MSSQVETRGIPLHSGTVPIYENESVLPEFQTRASNYDRDVKPIRLAKGAQAIFWGGTAVFVLGVVGMVVARGMGCSNMGIIGGLAGLSLVGASSGIIGSSILTSKRVQAARRSVALTVVSDTFEKVGKERNLNELMGIITVSRREFGKDLNGLTPTEKAVVDIAKSRLHSYLKLAVEQSTDRNLKSTNDNQMKALKFISELLPEEYRIARMNTVASRNFIECYNTRFPTDQIQAAG